MFSKTRQLVISSNSRLSIMKEVSLLLIALLSLTPAAKAQSQEQKMIIEAYAWNACYGLKEGLTYKLSNNLQDGAMIAMASGQIAMLNEMPKRYQLNTIMIVNFINQNKNNGEAFAFLNHTVPRRILQICPGSINASDTARLKKEAKIK